MSVYVFFTVIVVNWCRGQGRGGRVCPGGQGNFSGLIHIDPKVVPSECSRVSVRLSVSVVVDGTEERTWSRGIAGVLPWGDGGDVYRGSHS